MLAIASFAFGILVLAVAAGGAVVLWRAARALAKSDRWLLVVVAGGIVSFTTLAVMGEIEGVLASMHPLGRAGRGLMDLIGDPVRARGTIDAWQTWFTQPYASAAARPPLAPKTVALWYLFLDSAALVPAYALSLGVLLRRSRTTLFDGKTKALADRESVDEPTLERFTTVARTALGLFALVPFLDLLENGMLWRFLERRTQACGSGVCEGVDVPGDGYILLLRFVSYFKILFLVAALVVALAPGAVWLRLGADWFRKIRPTFRRLRGEVILLLLFFLLMKVNPQTNDLFRGWDLVRGILAFAGAFLAGVVTWSVGSRVAHVRRGRNAAGDPIPKKDPGTSRLWMVGAGFVLAGLGSLSYLVDVLPRGLLIPGVFLILLAWFDRAGEAVVVPEPPVPQRGRETVPAAVAAAWPILLSYFVAKALFPLTMYDDAHGFLYTGGVYALFALVVPALSIGVFYYLLRHLIPDDTPSDPTSETQQPASGSKLKQVVSGAIKTSAPTKRKGFPVVEYVLIGIGILLWIRVVMNPWAVGQAFGAVALVVGFFAVLCALVGLASLFVERTEPPGLFKVLRMQRIPLFVLLVLWLVLTNVIPGIERQDFHDVRMLRSGVDPTVGDMSSLDVFNRWVANQSSLAAKGSSGASRQAVPLILVATEGGGVKAATWTALVLDCVISPDPIVDRCPSHAASRLPSVIAESGVSGGSLGLVEYTRFAAAPSLATKPGDWIDQRLGADFISPSIAWQLFVETPRAWLQFDNGMDRAEVLERGWEQPWVQGDRYGFVDALFHSAPPSGGPLAGGFRALWAENQNVPLLMLNGFSVQDGCKFVTTPIDGNGVESDSVNCVLPHSGVAVSADPSEGRPGFLSGSRVLPDLLCSPEDDVRLSTAALLSARFPYGSPSGRLLSCPTPSGDPRRAINVVDGGYGDNTGAGSVLELWQSIRPLVDQYNGDPGHGACIVPALLQIQSGYGPSADVPSAAQRELSVPPKGILHAPNGFTVWQRNAAQLAILDPLPFTGSATQPAREGVFALVYPYAHPGAEAPLGWTLSDEARIDLRGQLSAEGNVTALTALEDFLDHPGTCAPVGQAHAFGGGG
jgi:hypothetical protein